MYLEPRLVFPEFTWELCRSGTNAFQEISHVQVAAPPSSVLAAFVMLLGSAIAGSFVTVEAQTYSAITQPGSGPVALTPAQIKAAKSLTPAQIAQLKVKLQPILVKLKAQIAASEQQRMPIPSFQDVFAGNVKAAPKSLISPPQIATFTFTSKNGQRITAAPTAAILASTGSGVSSASSPTPLFAPPCLPGKCCGSVCPIQGPVSGGPQQDNDQDGLPDSFESQLADEFTPVHNISGQEEQYLATFGNHVPQTVASLLGPNTPYSYYRVVPAGMTADGRFVIHIDDLTLWNADGGLPGGSPACDLSFVGIDQVIQELTGHELDAERSGMYVAAPAVNGSFNPDPNAYSIGYIYTAAHEETFFDHRSFGNFAQGTVPAGSHVSLGLSLSKHSTYPFNPDYLNLIPAGYIAAYTLSSSAALYDGPITDTEYAYAELIANSVFFGCIVERFYDQGGSIAQQRVHVGEPAHPVDGSAFIQDNSSRALN